MLLFLYYFEDYYLWEVYPTIEVLTRVIMDVIAILFKVWQYHRWLDMDMQRIRVI